MKKHKSLLVIFLLSISCTVLPFISYGADMGQFTAYPSFITHSVTPNILLLLDESGSMQCSAYTPYIDSSFGGYDGQTALCPNENMDTDSSAAYAYYSSRDYYGYFKKDEYYQYNSETGKFVPKDKDTCSFTSNPALEDFLDRVGEPDCISGNLLNWATMSRVDILRKALFGGKSIAQQGDTFTLRGEGGRWSFTDYNLGCKFSLTGGGASDISHMLTITDMGIGGVCENEPANSDDFNGNPLDSSKWSTGDFGIIEQGGPPGSENLTDNPGSLTVMGAGSIIWDSEDKYHYVYQQLSGDFDIRLYVQSVPTNADYSKSGLMIRNTTDPKSARIHYMATNCCGLQFAYRDFYNYGTDRVTGEQIVSYPIWIRLTRTGKFFRAYYSADGKTWQEQGGGKYMEYLNNTVYVGIAAASYDLYNVGTSVFGEFQKVTCNGCPLDPLENANIEVDATKEEKRGVIHAVADKDYNDAFDVDAPRFGLLFYSGSNSTTGCIESGIIKGDNDPVSTPLSLLIEPIEDKIPYSSTPTGEALREAAEYLKQENLYSYCSSQNLNNDYICPQKGCIIDPWYDNGQSIWCRKSFILLISDGEWNGTVDPVRPARSGHVNDIRPDIPEKQIINHFTIFASFGSGMNANSGGRNSMQLTSMYGNFEDRDSNTWPYKRTSYPLDSRAISESLPSSPCDPSDIWDDMCKEWDMYGPDSIPDGIPDSFYEASEGEQLESALIDAIAYIMQSASSGSAVSVLSTTGDGEGAVYQAYFYSSRTFGSEPVQWIGYLQALFVDKYGNLRANTYNSSHPQLDYGLDSNGNCNELQQDQIVRFYYDNTTNSTLSTYYRDKNCDGKYDGFYEDLNGDGFFDEFYQPEALPPVPLEFFTGSIWEAGELLRMRSPNDPAPDMYRVIYTTVDGSTFMEFSDTKAPELMTFLQTQDINKAENLINYVRGVDIGGYRKRTVNGNVWKLGDIIHSTPTPVGKPGENYGILYKDSTYRQYKNKHYHRRQVIYVGANDGMLHAFNGGFFDYENQRFWKNYTSDSGFSDSGIKLGAELWAFIPKSALPHLKWYADPGYTHVYYVDGKPKVTDVQIFTPDNDIHVGGWGTILIGSMRYGGKKGADVRLCSLNTSKACTSDDDCSGEGTCSVELNSSYFALDVTDPLNPDLLWTFDDPENMGLTTSYPTVLRTGAGENEKWFAVFGSGPTLYSGISQQTASIYVLDISDGKINTWVRGSNYWRFDAKDINGIPDTNAFMADPISIDVDLDKDVDVIYIGNTYCPEGKTCPPLENEPSSWAGKMYRINVSNGGESTNPSIWELSTLYGSSLEPVGPVTSAPSATMDESGNLWLYFGTGRFLSDFDKIYYPDHPPEKDGDRYSFYGIKDVCRPWINDTCSSTEICPGTVISTNPIPSSYVVNVNTEEVDASECKNNDGNFIGLYCSSHSDCWAKPDIPEDGIYCDTSSSEASFKNILLGDSTDPNDGGARACDVLGWQYEFVEAGERTQTKPLVFGGLVIWTTYKPVTDICSSEGESFIYAVYYETGTAYEQEVFAQRPDSTGKIAKRKKLGFGMPSAVGASVRDANSITAFSHSSTGTIMQVNIDTAKPVKSGFEGWKNEKIRFDILE
jgi:Tfp pilus tip-associated adhesin PilY1/regulation of enolase protein 1 (concanavalin A-like superfamily)